MLFALAFITAVAPLFLKLLKDRLIERTPAIGGVDYRTLIAWFSSLGIVISATAFLGIIFMLYRYSFRFGWPSLVLMCLPLVGVATSLVCGFILKEISGEVRSTSGHTYRGKHAVQIGFEEAALILLLVSSVILGIALSQTAISLIWLISGGWFLGWIILVILLDRSYEARNSKLLR